VSTDNSNQTNTESNVVQRLESIKWIASVNETDRPHATYKLVTERAVVRMDYEIHTIENCGATIQALSQTGHYGCHVYVNIS